VVVCECRVRDVRDGGESEENESDDVDDEHRPVVDGVIRHVTQLHDLARVQEDAVDLDAQRDDGCTNIAADQHVVQEYVENHDVMDEYFPVLSALSISNDVNKVCYEVT